MTVLAGRLRQVERLLILLAPAGEQHGGIAQGGVHGGNLDPLGQRCRGGFEVACGGLGARERFAERGGGGFDGDGFGQTSNSVRGPAQIGHQHAKNGLAHRVAGSSRTACAASAAAAASSP